MSDRIVDLLADRLMKRKAQKEGETEPDAFNIKYTKSVLFTTEPLEKTSENDRRARQILDAARDGAGWGETEDTISYQDGRYIIRVDIPDVLQELVGR